MRSILIHIVIPVLIALPLAPAASSAGAPSGGRWERPAPMPSARTEVAAAGLGTRIDVVGGLTRAASPAR